MNQTRLTVWEKVRMAAIGSIALTFLGLEVYDWFTKPTPPAESVPTWTYIAIFALVFAIFGIFMFRAHRIFGPAATSGSTETVLKPYQMSNDMRKLSMVVVVLALIGALAVVPATLAKLGSGIGTREWIRNLCFLLMYLILIPTWIHWTWRLWKKSPAAA